MQYNNAKLDKDIPERVKAVFVGGVNIFYKTNWYS